MADTTQRARENEEGAPHAPSPALAPLPEDHRRPYESPRIMKKRSLSSATLFTVMTQSSIGLTMMG